MEQVLTTSGFTKDTLPEQLDEVHRPKCLVSLSIHSCSVHKTYLRTSFRKGRTKLVSLTVGFMAASTWAGTELCVLVLNTDTEVSIDAFEA